MRRSPEHCNSSKSCTCAECRHTRGSLAVLHMLERKRFAGHDKLYSMGASACLLLMLLVFVGLDLYLPAQSDDRYGTTPLSAPSKFESAPTVDGAAESTLFQKTNNNVMKKSKKIKSAKRRIPNDVIKESSTSPSPSLSSPPSSAAESSEVFTLNQEDTIPVTDEFESSFLVRNLDLTSFLWHKSKQETIGDFTTVARSQPSEPFCHLLPNKSLPYFIPTTALEEKSYDSCQAPLRTATSTVVSSADAIDTDLYSPFRQLLLFLTGVLVVFVMVAFVQIARRTYGSSSIAPPPPAHQQQINLNSDESSNDQEASQETPLASDDDDNDDDDEFRETMKQALVVMRTLDVSACPEALDFVHRLAKYDALVLLDRRDSAPTCYHWYLSAGQHFHIVDLKNRIDDYSQKELEEIGDEYYYAENYEAAIEVYTLAVEKDAFCDELVSILYCRYYAYDFIRKWKLAYEDAGYTCGIRPDDSDAFLCRAVSAAKLGEWQVALESYEELDKLDSSGDRSNKHSAKQRTESSKKILRMIEEVEVRRKSELEVLIKEVDAMTGFDVSASCPVSKKSRIFEIMYEGCLEMNFEKIELAVKNGADLYTPFLSPSSAYEFPNVPSRWSSFSFFGFKKAKEILAEEGVMSELVLSGLRCAFITIINQRFPSQELRYANRNLANQVEFFDKVWSLFVKTQPKRKEAGLNILRELCVREKRQDVPSLFVEWKNRVKDIEWLYCSVDVDDSSDDDDE